MCMPQTPFLTQVAERVLATGFDELTDAQKEQYVPTLASLIEERIGIELLPKLNEEQTEQFVDLVENEKTTPGEWRDFWSAAVPSFEEVVAGIVGEFVQAAANVR